jgi:hypothetical protein
MAASTTTTSAGRRVAGIDRRTVKPALLVLALAVLMSVVLPSIDGETPYRDEVHSGDLAAVGDGITLVPRAGTSPAERSSAIRARPSAAPPRPSSSTAA